MKNTLLSDYQNQAKRLILLFEFARCALENLSKAKQHGRDSGWQMEFASFIGHMLSVYLSRSAAAAKNRMFAAVRCIT